MRPRSTSVNLGYILIFICAFGCSHQRSDSTSNETVAYAQPTSQPTSNPASYDPHDTSRDAEGAAESAWGEASFGQAIDPQSLHRPEADQGVAVFAGGCFWCMEAPFESLTGVRAVYSGYTGGHESRPTYGQVAGSRTHHLEAVVVFYQPSLVTYEQLLHRYWRSVNPTQADGQFADRGPQYLTAIFAVDQVQGVAAQRSKQALTASKKFSEPIAVKILKARTFWPAEDYHQDYYKTNSAHYQRYKIGSGRAGYLKRVWGESAQK